MKTLFENELQNFEISNLEDNRIAFENRFDTKFLLKIGGALDFLKNVGQNYSVMQVCGQKIQNYANIYFDTADLFCFNMHKSGRVNRFKFRTRKYLSNGKIYNEIKKKLNTGKTLKFRQKSEIFEHNFDENFRNFAKNGGFECENLTPMLSVDFSRITLLSKKLSERITLDFGLKYEHSGKKIKLCNTCIVEIKREKSDIRSFSHEYFREKHILPSGFSKYCIGICLTNDMAKKNLFLPKIRILEREEIL